MTDEMVDKILAKRRSIYAGMHPKDAAVSTAVNRTINEILALLVNDTSDENGANLSRLHRSGIRERCGGKEIVGDGLKCPYCGAFETYKNANDLDNADQWYFVIRAFRVDDSSECTNCNNWFTC